MGYNSDAANAAKGGKMMMKRAVWALLTIGALTLSASAQTWTEQGDAGDLPETAQSTGSGTLSQIQGSLDVNDVDMYAIYITDPAAFSASTVGGATWDTQLFLFDANGVGVVAEDDTGGLQSTINNTAGCITAPGLYYLAITRYNKDPLGCNDGGLWSTNDNNCPNGTESSSRVNSWTSSTDTAGSYTIFLTGVEGATAGDPADCPPFEGWDEFANGGGDAGDLPETAQSTGSGALTAIRGTIGAANDVDVYAIYISDPSTFSATTIGGTSLDTALWLFDEDGKGVVHNEDNPDATTGLQSRIDNRTFCISQPGRYYLAISLFGRRAAGCNEGLIWATTPARGVRCADGPESTSRVAGWSGSTTSTGTYRIFLTGAEGATAGDPADCPPFEGWDELLMVGAMRATCQQPPRLSLCLMQPLVRRLSPACAAIWAPATPICMSSASPTLPASPPPPLAVLASTPSCGSSAATARVWCIMTTPLARPCCSRASITPQTASPQGASTCWQSAATTLTPSMPAGSSSGTTPHFGRCAVPMVQGGEPDRGLDR
jgi:hypothetical protein